MSFSKWLASLVVIALLAGGSAVLAANQAKPASSSAGTQAKVALVNLNTATLKQLEALPGVGPKIAQQIIKYRPYKNVSDFRAKVKLVNQAEWLKIQKLVTF